MNTLTRLIPDFYRALDVVSRELSGFLMGSVLDAQAARAAINQAVVIPIVPAQAAEDIVPAALPPESGDQSLDNVTFEITKSRAVPFRWTGEEQLGVNNGGVSYLTLRQNQIAQALRTLVNEVEVDIALTAALGASRAYGISGTPPFGTTPGIADSAQLLKILEDNGAPSTDLSLVINTAAAANLRSLGNLFKVNEAGDDDLLRQGILGDLHGFGIRSSAGIRPWVKGTGAGYTTDGAAYAVGATDIALITGTGTVKAGDHITFAGDTNKYVVASGIAAPGTIVLAAPGLRQAIPAAATAVTIGGAAGGVNNVGFHRGAMVIAARAPAIPEEGDSASDRMIITDPRTNISFEVAVYPQYKRVRYEVGLAWGAANIKPEHTAILLG
jgi:hypothetical protein